MSTSASRLVSTSLWLGGEYLKDCKKYSSYENGSLLNAGPFLSQWYDMSLTLFQATKLILSEVCIFSISSEVVFFVCTQIYCKVITDVVHT